MKMKTLLRLITRLLNFLRSALWVAEMDNETAKIKAVVEVEVLRFTHRILRPSTELSVPLRRITYAYLKIPM